jgi:hypothetical protein
MAFYNPTADASYARSLPVQVRRRLMSTVAYLANERPQHPF